MKIHSPSLSSRPCNLVDPSGHWSESIAQETFKNNVRFSHGVMGLSTGTIGLAIIGLSEGFGGKTLNKNEDSLIKQVISDKKLKVELEKINMTKQEFDKQLQNSLFSENSLMKL
ncbi:MAG: hypothetical protein HQK52_15730 [Oligoflexia bacterium]|nr:hypothetical protein [Oligoflexia bacterium]